MLEIKLLGPGEVEHLANIAPDVFDDPIVESSAHAFLADPHHRLVVAVDNDLVVGFVSAVIYMHPDKPTPELWINEIGVAPSYQGQGIGRSLLQAMLDDAKQSGCMEAWVLTERENTAAMALYTSLQGAESSPDAVMFTFNL